MFIVKPYRAEAGAYETDTEGFIQENSTFNMVIGVISLCTGVYQVISPSTYRFR
jgi:hypothetical protein